MITRLLLKGKTMKIQLTAACLLLSASVAMAVVQFPIENGVLRNQLDAGGYDITNAHYIKAERVYVETILGNPSDDPVVVNSPLTAAQGLLTDTINDFAVSGFASGLDGLSSTNKTVGAADTHWDIRRVVEQAPGAGVSGADFLRFENVHNYEGGDFDTNLVFDLFYDVDDDTWGIQFSCGRVYFPDGSRVWGNNIEFQGYDTMFQSIKLIDTPNADPGVEGAIYFAGDTLKVSGGSSSFLTFATLPDLVAYDGGFSGQFALVTSLNRMYVFLDGNWRGF